ncbi:MAG TPA: hypothetical protein VLV78_08245 [Thermoanaerobaculia bacterium]|nr:hypothetical protein [Thermoanaerobaculia bacterium]
MTQDPIHTLETASSAHRLEQVRKKLGFIPNLYAVLAEAPAALESIYPSARRSTKPH